MPYTPSAAKRAAQSSMPEPCSSAKRVAQPSKFLDFKNALVDLGNADTPVVAELSEMFKELSKQPGFDELQKKLSEDGQKLAKTIFGIPEEVPARPLPKLLFGHPPELANKIFQGLEPIDLLNFATVSKASISLVESLSTKVDSISITYCSEFARITITTTNQKLFDFKIATSKESLEESRRDGTNRRIGDCEFTISRCGYLSVNCYTIHCSDKEELVRILTRFFFGIYRTEDVLFYIDSPRVEFMLYVIKNITTQFSSFKIDADVELTDEEFRVVMEDISVNGWFYFESNRDYNYDRPFRHMKMSLKMPWKLSNLIDMRCKELDLYNHQFTVEELKTFAQNWKEGGMAQLEEVYFGMELGDLTAEKKKDQVWISLKSLGFTDQSPQLPLPSGKIWDEPERLLHIQRGDGRVASLEYIPAAFGSNRYSFFVWN